MIKQRLLQTLIESYGGIEPLVEEIEQLMEYGGWDASEVYGVDSKSHSKAGTLGQSFGSFFNPEMKSGNRQHALTRIGNAVNYTKDPSKTVSSDDKKYVSDLNSQLNGGSASKTSSPARTGGARASARVGARTPTAGRSSRLARPVAKTTARATGTAGATGTTGNQQTQNTTSTGQTTASNILNKAKSAIGGSGIANGFKTATQTQSAQKPQTISQENDERDNFETAGISGMVAQSRNRNNATSTPSSASTTQTTPQSKGYVQGQKLGTGTGGNYTHNDYKSWSSDQQKAFAKNNPNTVRQWNKGNTSLQANQVRGPRPTPQATANVLSNTAGTAGGIGSTIKK